MNSWTSGYLTGLGMGAWITSALWALYAARRRSKQVAETLKRSDELLERLAKEHPGQREAGK